MQSLITILVEKVLCYGFSWEGGGGSFASFFTLQSQLDIAGFLLCQFVSCALRS